MKKIGILTYCKSINYGAYMQCYALALRISKDFPDCSVEVIDYSSEQNDLRYTGNLLTYLFGSKKYRNRFRAAVKKGLHLLKNPAYLSNVRKKNKAFKNAWKELNLSEVSLVSDDFTALFRLIKNKYDVIVVGSDCVWEYKNYPFPNAYLLNADVGSKKLSYAACSGQMLAAEMSSEQRRYFAEAISGFDYIGVRDKATEKFVGEILPGARLHHNCDPSILLDLNELPDTSRKLKSKLSDAGVDFSKPVVCLMGNEALGRLLHRVIGGKYQIVALHTANKYADAYLGDISPFEWARCFSLFSLTVTSFFHGTIFSLKNGVPTITFDPWQIAGNCEHKTKIQDLYDRLSLGDGHLFRYKSDYGEDEIDLIKASVETFIHEPKADLIARAIEREAGSYQSFKAAMENL